MAKPVRRDSAHLVRSLSASLFVLSLLSFPQLAHASPLVEANMPDYLHGENVVVPSDAKFCGPYAVWHALNLRGIHVPIAQLVRETGCDDKGSTISGLVSALQRHGVPARAVRLDSQAVAGISDPFIVFLSDSREEVGHFALVVPSKARGDAVVLDGARKPSTIPLSWIKESRFRQFWNGEAVLVASSSGLAVPRWVRDSLLYLLAGGVVTISALYFLPGFLKGGARQRLIEFQGVSKP